MVRDLVPGVIRGEILRPGRIRQGPREIHGGIQGRYSPRVHADLRPGQQRAGHGDPVAFSHPDVRRSLIRYVILDFHQFGEFEPSAEVPDAAAVGRGHIGFNFAVADRKRTVIDDTAAKSCRGVLPDHAAGNFGAVL